MTLDARFAGLARHDQDRLLTDLARAKPVEGEPPEVTAARLFAELAGIPFDGAARAEPGSEWQTDVLDLPAYLRRVGWVGEAPPPSLESLRALHWAHLTAIGFHNLDVLLGRPISHELPDIQRKLVTARKPATCVEHNLLFAAVLERLGFAVTRLAGRPRIGRPVVLPATHAALLVSLPEGDYLVDVGVGGDAPIEPVPLAGGETGRDAWLWRVVEDAGTWVLEVSRPAGWVALYSFDVVPRRLADYLLTYYYSVTYPGIPIAYKVVASRVTADVRHVLTGDRYTRTTSAGDTETRTLDGPEVVSVLTEVFGARLSDDEWKTVLR